MKKNNNIEMGNNVTDEPQGIYKTPHMHMGNIESNDSVEGDPIEIAIEKMIKNTGNVNKDEKTAPLLYQERKEGIKKAYDIRTDKWEVAVEAGQKIAESYDLRRKPEEKQEDGETKSIHGESDKSVPE